MSTWFPQLYIHDLAPEDRSDRSQRGAATQGYYRGLPEGPGCLGSTVANAI